MTDQSYFILFEKKYKVDIKTPGFFVDKHHIP